MDKEYKIESSIRGDFYRIELTKRYPGMPGFAPDYYDIHIGDVVVKFRDEKPYFQTKYGDGGDVLTKEDLKEIIGLLNRGYVKKDFE